MNLRNISIILLAVLLASCAGTRTITQNTLRPAEIDVPSDIKTVGIVDRSVID